jgi:ABC-type Zn uptake system ZnuABC Zn-binding protein ZnuA
LEQGAEERIRQVILTRLTSKISEEKAEEFQERLKALLKEFDDANIETAERAEALQDYALMVTFYPSFYFHGPEEEQK